MKRLPLVLALVLGSLLVACGGGSSSSIAERTPGASAPRNTIAFGAVDAARASGLYSVQQDGTRLLKLSGEPAAVSFPRWSPDGASVAYIVGGGREAGANATLRVYDFAMSASTTVSTNVLAAGDEPPMAWSPDGKQIAFIESSGGGRLRVFDFSKGQLLDSPAVPATAVDWSSRDELVIVAPTGQTSSAVYTLTPDGKKKRQLPTRAGVDDDPVWSRDGKTLAFWNGPSIVLSQRELFALATGEAPAKDLGPGTDASWSNDGRLAYSRPPAAGTTGFLDVYTSGLAGQQPTRLTQSVTLDRWPSWSPASDTVAYLAAADPSTTFLCTIIVATLSNDCLNLPGLRPGAPAWSPY